MIVFNTKKTPKMPPLGKGTECIKLVISQVSKDMQEPLVPMLFPILGSKISDTQFQYPDRSWKETCGMMATLGGALGAIQHKCLHITTQADNDKSKCIIFA